MYGSAVVPPKVPTPQEREKAASRVLGGMKIHNSHLKRIQVGEELVDVPKIEYVKLLEDQVRDARNRIRELEGRYSRLQNNHNKLVGEIHDIRRELNNKVSLR
jgi:predicted nuclease with TOPRIM domain